MATLYFFIRDLDKLIEEILGNFKNGAHSSVWKFLPIKVNSRYNINLTILFVIWQKFQMFYLMIQVDKFINLRNFRKFSRWGRIVRESESENQLQMEYLTILFANR